MKNKLSFFIIFFICLGCWQTAATLEKEKAYEKEQQRLAELDVAALDLPYLVNLADEIGGDTQLNWKEITAIAAAKLQNQLRPLHLPTFEAVATDFLAQDGVQKFETVAQKHLQGDYYLRAFSYLEDLTDTGYVPEKLQPEAPERQYIEQLSELAKENYYETGLLPSIMIAQTILEHGWDEPPSLGDIPAFSGAPLPLDELGPTYRHQAKTLEEAGLINMTDESGLPVYAKRLGELIRQYNLQLIDYDVLYK